MAQQRDVQCSLLPLACMAMQPCLHRNNLVAAKSQRACSTVTFAGKTEDPLGEQPGYEAAKSW